MRIMYLLRFNHEFLHKVILSYSADKAMNKQGLRGLAHGHAFNIPVLA